MHTTLLVGFQEDLYRRSIKLTLYWVRRTKVLQLDIHIPWTSVLELNLTEEKLLELLLDVFRTILTIGLGRSESCGIEEC